ncbi:MULTISPECIES: potassium-transporting ATPase subunit F [unclassified Microbacterium]|nr:potassium-transporting ATPase subunit F [Microbacterium sp. MAH-37]MVQ41533.1 potassium-transporting ATPase subunit F [Microbacterium sp. MAH-37]
MIVFDLAAVALGLLAAGYLLVALIAPEKF